MIVLYCYLIRGFAMFFFGWANTSMIAMAYANHLIHPSISQTPCNILKLLCCLALLQILQISFWIPRHTELSHTDLSKRISMHHVDFLSSSSHKSELHGGVFRVEAFVRETSVFTNMFQLSCNHHQLKFET